MVYAGVSSILFYSGGQSTMTKTLRAGVIGAGAISTRSHIPAYQAAGDVNVVAVCDVKKERAASVAKELEIPASYGDYRDMLANEDLDLVSVCIPNALHAQAAIDAMRAGAHVLCEKPMAVAYADAREMVAVSQETGKSLTIGHHMRYQPATRAAKDLVMQGRLGNVYYAKASYLRRSGIPGYGSWFTNKDLAGGGALMDIGCHMLDLVLWLMGYPKPVSVTASTYAEFGPKAKGLGGWGADHFGPGARFDVDDLSTAFVRFENGATLLLEASWATQGTQGQRYQVYGTEGGLEYNADLFGTETPLHCFGEDADGLTEEAVDLPEATTVGHQALLNAWLEAVRAGKQPVIRAEQGAVVVQIIEAAYKSAKTGSQVTLD